MKKPSKTENARKIPIESDGEEIFDEAVHTMEDAVHAVEEEHEPKKLEHELESTLQHMKRLQAEFDNYRRRTERERLETGDWARGGLVKDLLPALDDLDRAIEAAQGGESSLVEGFTMVRDKLIGELERAGMERINTDGVDFDPNLHEALLTEPVDEEQNGKVLQELVAGYTFAGRVIRPARVKVGVTE